MLINIYDENGAKKLTPEPVDLAQAIGDDNEETGRAMVELTTMGRYWIGGGDAPLFLLMRA